MTTKVTVDAHAGWDVKVTTEEFEHSYSQIVPKNTTQDFYVCTGRKLTIEEVTPGVSDE